MMIRRTFWCLSKGKSIGFIESVHKSGILFSTDYVNIRETSSNLSNGNVMEVSVSKLPYDKMNKLDYYMNNKIPVCVHFSRHLIGSPLKGEIITPQYIEDITPLSEETLHVRGTVG